MTTLRKITIIAGAVLLALAAFVAYIALWTGSTKEIEAVANKFQPGDSWTLVSERIEPPRKLCLDAACPSLSRTWTMPQPLTREQFVETLPSEYKAKVEGNCPEAIPDELFGQYSCLAIGFTGGYKVNISYAIDPQLDNKYRVTLNVRKEP